MNFHSNISILRDAIGRWLSTTRNNPEDWDFTRKRIRYTFADSYDNVSNPGELILTPEVSAQNNLILGFLELLQSLSVMEQTEFYFRRYPFHGLPITKHDHMRNICEMYFGAVYTIRCKIKIVLNHLKTFLPSTDIRVADFIKAFDREFDLEIRARGQAVHRESFDEVGLSRLLLTSMMDDSEQTGTNCRQNYEFREFQKRWSKRVRLKSRIAKQFVEEVASAILENSGFL